MPWLSHQSLALFPAILFLLALASFFPLSNLTDDLGRSLSPIASPQLIALIPGAVVATALWLIGFLGFKIYVSRFADYEGSYGTVGGVIVALLWFYVSGIAIPVSGA